MASLLVMYAIGCSFKAILVATSISFIRWIGNNEKYVKTNRFFKIIVSILMVILAIYMFYLGL